MLNADALTKLNQLKTDIEASKDYGEGTVAGSTGRFGFVRLEDGRDAFLSPEKMQYLLPGDRVKVLVNKNAKGKWEASIEKLLSSSLKRFVGQYKIKGNGHFVVPLGAQTDENGKHYQVNRWIFVPPKVRLNCADGDLVIAQVTRHPIKDTKAQAKVVDRIGQESDSKIENTYVTAKYELKRKPSAKVLQQCTQIQDEFAALTAKIAEDSQRVDYSALPFVTIDAPTTRDMDDAIACVPADDGSFQLYIAIAEPAACIKQSSPTAYYAQYCAQTVYLLGGALPMLPGDLGTECFSLLENELRPALVCSIKVTQDGAIDNYKFELAYIKSRHKLAYDDVANFIDEDTELHSVGSDVPLSDEIKSMLTQLYAVAKSRTRFRRQQFAYYEDQSDFDISLDKDGKITQITCKPRTSAHQIVEEAMIATNMCAGEFLSEKNLGLHMVHKGFREDRIGEAKALLKEEGIAENQDISTLEGYIELNNRIAADDEKKHLLAPLRRLTYGAELSLEPGPHLGMGFPHYATVTSPIRRFADLYNHWAMRHALVGDTFSPLTPEQLEKVETSVQTSRQADRELSLWLISQYAQNLIGTIWKGKIRIVTQQGFGVRLHENGIDGFVLFDKNTEKRYDAKRMTLEVAGECYSLEKEVTVKVEKVDLEKRRIALTLMDEHGDERLLVVADDTNNQHSQKGSAEEGKSEVDSKSHEGETSDSSNS